MLAIFILGAAAPSLGPVAMQPELVAGLLPKLVLGHALHLYGLRAPLEAARLPCHGLRAALL